MLIQTLDWVSRLDTQFYPILDTEETTPRILVRLLEDRQSRVLPEAKRAQTEVELRLRAVETLQVQGQFISENNLLYTSMENYRGIHHSTRQTYFATARVEPALHNSGVGIPSSVADDDPLLQKRGRSKTKIFLGKPEITFYFASWKTQRKICWANSAWP